jgi:molecular chaperone DnaK
LGGDDFDERVATWIVGRLKSEKNVDVSKDLSAMQRIREAAETAKKELSTVDSTQIVLPYLTQIRGEVVHFETTLTRTRFNELIKDLIERTAAPVQMALNDAGIAASELGKVLLVGGSTRIPAVQNKVKMLTGKEPSKNINPDECVAMGAAVLGSTLQGNALVAAGTGQNLLLLDVTPLSLSIETVGGVSTRLIERNSTLPAKYSKVFTTVTPYQKNVEIRVLQGERTMAKDNKLIGKFILKGLKRAGNGMPQIHVTFDIDANGILKVSAQDETTGKMESITITADDRMSEAEIQQAMRDAQEYAGTDHMRREALEVVSEAQRLVRRTEQKMRDLGKALDKTKKKDMKKACAELQKSLNKFRVDKVTEDDINKIKAGMTQLEQFLN